MSRKTKNEPTVWIPRGLFLLSPAEGSVVTGENRPHSPGARLGPVGGTVFVFSISLTGIYVRACSPGSFEGGTMEELVLSGPRI